MTGSEYAEAVLKGYCAAITKAVRRQCKGMEIVSNSDQYRFEIVFKPRVGAVCISGTLVTTREEIIVLVSPGNHRYTFKLQDPHSVSKCKQCVKSVVGRWKAGLSDQLIVEDSNGTPACWLTSFHPEKRR